MAYCQILVISPGLKNFVMGFGWPYIGGGGGGGGR